jgi:hypothetical protein
MLSVIKLSVVTPNVAAPEKKTFIIERLAITSGPNVIKLFTTVIYKWL